MKGQLETWKAVQEDPRFKRFNTALEEEDLGKSGVEDLKKEAAEEPTLGSEKTAAETKTIFY